MQVLGRPAPCAESGGEGGIRTRDGLPRTAFPVRRHSPLGDLSKNAADLQLVEMAAPGKAEPSTGASAPEGA